MSLRLTVNGKLFEGWITAEVERSLDEFANRFSLGYLDRWAAEAEPWEINVGARAVLSWGDETLITGHVNVAQFRAGAQEWELVAEGRSAVGDLVDCSATHKTGHWKNKTASAIITDLIAPYGLTLSVDVPDTEPFKRFTIREGDSVHAEMEKLCKVRALIPISKPDGGVRLFSANAQSKVIKLDVASAKSRAFYDSDSMRFSTYLMRATGVGSDLEAFVKAQVADTGVKRFRPLVVVDDAPASTKQARLRAQWEANVRAGRGESLIYDFMNPRNLEGRTYAPGQFYRVQDDLFGVDEVFVVRHAVLRNTANEINTRVSLVRPETYSQFSYPPKKLIKKTQRKKTSRVSLGNR